VHCIAFILKQLVRTVTVIHASQTTQYIIDNPLKLIAKIRERHMKAGVAISPDTASTSITDEVGNAADMLLVMTVYPGTFDPASFLSAFTHRDLFARSWGSEISRAMHSQSSRIAR